jgi:S-adenosylmethionine:tRNA ribosyltransferase-isomerase
VRLEELDFAFSEELIAQHPCEPRDACRLLVMQPDGRLSHQVFRDLPRLLVPGDVLVLNDSRVLRARVSATKPTGGRVELLFLHEQDGDHGDGETWEVLARPSSRLREGLDLALQDRTRATLLEPLGDGRWLVRLPPGCEGAELLERVGSVPLPPYIKEALRDPAEYQTVYAAAAGSAAAPTAGLHFTPRLLEDLVRAGVETAKVTLHVGLDTFRPVSSQRVEDHHIHREAFSVRAGDLDILERARAEGRRLVAVGTTSVRVLETVYAEGAEWEPGGALTGHASLFITPGYRFRAVDAMLTNFHLPRTTLLALVMAFAGVDEVRAAYAEAVQERYRFFSFGDAVLLFRRARA